MNTTGALALVFAAAAFPAAAGQSSAPFVVNVNLQPVQSPPSLCQVQGTGSTHVVLTVACIDDPPQNPVTRESSTVPGSAYRFKLPGNGGDLMGAIDVYSGAGTITSWRVLHIADRDYLEMTVGW